MPKKDSNLDSGNVDGWPKHGNGSKGGLPHGARIVGCAARYGCWSYRKKESGKETPWRLFFPIADGPDQWAAHALTHMLDEDVKK